jgi:CBS domain-containing protein
MLVRDILRKKGHHVVTIESHRTIHEAIQSLVANNIGALLVLSADQQLVGIFTERDILREVAERADQLRETKVGDVMTRNVIIGVPEDTVEYVMGIMTQNRIRHLPVMEEDELVGIVSIGDVVNSHLHKTQFENRLLRDYIQGVTH